MKAKYADLAVHFINIGQFDSPVGQQYSINFVPQFKVYDPQGRLLAEERAGTNWVRTELERRKNLEEMGLGQ